MTSFTVRHPYAKRMTTARSFVNAHHSTIIDTFVGYTKITNIGTAHIRHQCRKTAVLSCHRYLFNSGVEKMKSI
jgi:hypothetical protein